jgi:hypothetical protein
MALSNYRSRCVVFFTFILLLPSISHSQDLLPPPGLRWTDHAADRNKVVGRYINASSDGWRWFAEASHGETAGVPFVLLRTLPYLAPDLWGAPEERFSEFGFFDVPDEFYRSESQQRRPMPLGMGWVLNPVQNEGYEERKSDIHFITLTCAACHVGRVKTEIGSTYLVGAPNAEIDVRKYRYAFELTADRLLSEASLDETVTQLAKIIRDLTKESGDTAFFGDWYGIDALTETRELELFLDKDKCRTILKEFAAKVRAGQLAVNKQHSTSYSLTNSPPLNGGTPGQSDGTGDLIPKLLLFRETRPELFGYSIVPELAHQTPIERFKNNEYDELPFQRATATDSMSVWMQKDRKTGQLDGSVANPFVRQIAAMTAVVGSSQGVNVKNADVTTQFLHRLPAPAYPFDVDLPKARRGGKLFEANCASCHRKLNDKVYSFEQIGTDMNRARVVSSVSSQKLLIDAFLATFSPETIATNPENGQVYKPKALPNEQIISDRSKPWQQGYVAGPLDGIWAKSPYLHNGSVPTLRHLLAPHNEDSIRPTVFLRGVSDFDQSSVGFEWDIRTAANTKRRQKNVARFDTRWDGASNLGHDSKAVNVDGRIQRMDWSGAEFREDLEDLLEYLKTL